RPGQLLELRPDPLGDLLACRERHARLADVAVDEPPQRWCGVRVGGGERRVHRVLRRIALERDVAGSAKQARRLDEQGRLARDERAGARDQSLAGDVLWRLAA